MDKITLSELEVYWHVGVTDEERANPQRLLVTVELGLDLSVAASSDNLARTIDYAAVSQKVLSFGDGGHWELIEALAGDIAAMVLEEFSPLSVTVEVKKFVIARARYVSVRITRTRRE
jgi:FolB domain-containing protein